MCKPETTIPTKSSKTVENSNGDNDNTTENGQTSSSNDDKQQQQQQQQEANDGNKNNDKKPKYHREKRDKEGQYILQSKPLLFCSKMSSSQNNQKHNKKKKKISKALQKHGKDTPSGGIEAMIPSIIGIVILIGAIMAKRGFRGRASVAGIDLGTTNSVICIQQPSKTIGEINCIEDPTTNSPIIPSVVTFLEPNERKVGPSSKIPSLLHPHPSYVLVGQKAKKRIETHPHHTLYNAKRVLGRPSNDPAITELRQEVEFSIIENQQQQQQDEEENEESDNNNNNEVIFQVDNEYYITPKQVGSYIINHLIQITKNALGHDNIKSAVIAVPAKFNTLQRQRTMEAYKLAGIKVARVVEEPTAAALAYGLHKKDGVEKILVYDFGGGTLDISILHVSDGYCEVMASDGDDRLGGADFDIAIAHLLSTRHQNVLQAMSYIDSEDFTSYCSKLSNNNNNNNKITESLPLCSISSFHTIGEQLKISLSKSGGNEIATAECLSLPINDNNDTNNDIVLNEELCNSLQPIQLQLTIEEYDDVVSTLYKRSIIPIKRLLNDLDLNQDDIDEIVMVGGTTRMPQIRNLVRNVFSNAQLNTHIDPDITVAYGAASVND